MIKLTKKQLLDNRKKLILIFGGVGESHSESIQQAVTFFENIDESVYQILPVVVNKSNLYKLINLNLHKLNKLAEQNKEYVYSKLETFFNKPLPFNKVDDFKLDSKYVLSLLKEPVIQIEKPKQNLKDVREILALVFENNESIKITELGEIKQYEKVTEFIVKPPMDNENEKKLKNLAAKTFKNNNCKVFATVKMGLTPIGEVWVEEIDKTPSLLNNSNEIKLLETSGIEIQEVIEALIKSAALKQELNKTAKPKTNKLALKNPAPKTVRKSAKKTTSKVTPKPAKRNVKK